jgi:hypothetical protein
MPRNASGTYSLPSAVNPVVGNTPATAAWANNTMSDIGNELTQSLDRNGRGAMLGQLQLDAGAVGAPGLAWRLETNSGLYRAGAGDLRFAIAGVDRLKMTASRLTISAALQATGQVLAEDGLISAPGLSFSGEAGAGLYRAGSHDVRLAVNSKDIAQATTKLSISAATAATGGTRQDALSLTNGDLDLSAVAYPTSTTAIANRLTPANVCKAWCVLNIDGSGSPFTISVDAGFNVASVARTSASTFTITLGSGFAAGNYAVVGQQMTGVVGSDTIMLNPTTRNTGSVVAGLSKSTGGSVVIDSWGTVLKMAVLFYGAQ